MDQLRHSGIEASVDAQIESRWAASPQAKGKGIPHQGPGVHGHGFFLSDTVLSGFGSKPVNPPPPRIQDLYGHEPNYVVSHVDHAPGTRHLHKWRNQVRAGQTLVLQGLRRSLQDGCHLLFGERGLSSHEPSESFNFGGQRTFVRLVACNRPLTEEFAVFVRERSGLD